MTELNIVPLDRSYGDAQWAVLRWQHLNKHILALCPRSWEDLPDVHKWCLIRILARREGYEPDWLDPELWQSLKRGLPYVPFDEETDLLIGGGRSNIRYGRGESRHALDRDYDQIIEGEAPQSWREPYE